MTTGHKKKAFSVHSIENTTSAIAVGFIVDLNMKHQMQVHSHVTIGIQGGVQKKRERIQTQQPLSLIVFRIGCWDSNPNIC